MNAPTKFIYTTLALTTLALMGCENNMSSSYNVDVEVKNIDGTIFESTAAVTESELYIETKQNCELTLFLSKTNEEGILVESGLNCFEGTLNFTPSFVVKEGESATLEIGEEQSLYSYTVSVTESIN
ncbi:MULTISPECIES: hypothetical protein [unclassified Pseudoalteromonas]|uniref:hypothetical protein n=1 Tax=unclassified Pseudoalteromonas TaxID=194690 RepID=UPI0030148C12